jgi:hypothetical protein
MPPAASASVPAGGLLVQPCSDKGCINRKMTEKKLEGDTDAEVEGGPWAVPQGSAKVCFFGSASQIKLDAPFWFQNAVNCYFAI